MVKFELSRIVTGDAIMTTPVDRSTLTDGPVDWVNYTVSRFSQQSTFLLTWSILRVGPTVIGSTLTNV